MARVGKNHAASGARMQSRSIGCRWPDLAGLFFVAILAFAALIPKVEANEIQISDQAFGSSSRVQYLKTKIGIEDGQSGAWSNYVSALQAYRAAVRGEREEEVQRMLGGAEPIDEGAGPVIRERPTQRATAKATLKAKFEALYATLDSSQQQVADTTLTAGECGR